MIREPSPRSHGENDFNISPVVTAALKGRAGTFEIDATFSVRGAGVTALFGPSGSGKTTTLRAVAGLHRLSGRVVVDGETWQSQGAAGTGNRAIFKPTHDRSVGYVFQEASLFPHLTVAENILFAVRRPGWRNLIRASVPPAMSNRFDELVQALGISPLLDRVPARLSGGERQRVAIARALLPAPKLLLMDEPLSAVDRSTKDEILKYLDAITTAFATPTLYVSHDLSEITRIADDIVLMANGRVTAQGPIDELMARLDLNPSLGRFEAGSLLWARVVRFDPASQLTAVQLVSETTRAGEGETPPPSEMSDRIVLPGRLADPGTLVRLRVRARDVALATQRPEGISIRNVLPGTLVALAEEPDTGFAETLIEIGPAQVRARITRDAVSALGLSVGTPVFALIKAISFDGRAGRQAR